MAVKLLSGGNAWIAKGEGDAPIRAYIAAMPGWKQAIAERIDELVAAHAALPWPAPTCGAIGVRR